MSAVEDMYYLFDMDGVLVDSKEAWYLSFNEAGEVSREEFEEKYWGRDMQANLEELGKTRKDFCENIFPRHAEAIEPIPGVAEVLSGLEGKKALITNTTSRCTSEILETLGLAEYFDAIVTSDEVEEGKPDPSIVRRAMEELGAKPEGTLVIGDSEHDIEAGRAAGCVTIGIGVEGDYTADTLEDIPGLIRDMENERK